MQDRNSSHHVLGFNTGRLITYWLVETESWHGHKIHMVCHLDVGVSPKRL